MNTSREWYRMDQQLEARTRELEAYRFIGMTTLSPMTSMPDAASSCSFSRILSVIIIGGRFSSAIFSVSAMAFNAALPIKLASLYHAVEHQLKIYNVVSLQPQVYIGGHSPDGGQQSAVFEFKFVT